MSKSKNAPKVLKTPIQSSQKPSPSQSISLFGSFVIFSIHDADTTQIEEGEGAPTETVGAVVGIGQSKPSQQHSSKMTIIY
jgi:hypothetical protein